MPWLHLPYCISILYKSMQAHTNSWNIQVQIILQVIHLGMMECCILVWKDLKFSKAACFAWHIVTKQLRIPDHENLRQGLRIFFWCVLAEQLHLPVLFTKMLPLWSYSLAKLKSCSVYVSSFTLQEPTIFPLQKLKSAVLTHYYTLLRVTTYLLHESHGSWDQPSAQELTKYMRQPSPAPALVSALAWSWS